MKIKSFILAMVLTSASFIAFAQKEVATAKSNYQKYQDLKGTSGTEKIGSIALKAAKDAIDKGVANPKIQSDPVLWSYKALIYADLALLDTVESRNAPIIAEAISALDKAKELDKEGANKVSIESARLLISQNYLNLGVSYFKTKDYPKAYAQMKNGLTYSPTDSVLVLYSALMALYSKDFKSAIAQYKVAIANKQVNAELYNNLVDLYIAEKDTVTAIKVASEGSVLFPKDNNIATKEIEYSLMIGKNKEIIDKITKQAQNEPTNKLFPYYLGLAYSATNDNVEAEKAYRASIAIDPNFAEPYINIGSLILNNGIITFNTTNRLPQNQQAEYTAGMKKANDEFEKAFPYLKKATELNPKSRLALMNLKKYYDIKRETEKSAEIAKLLDAIPE